MKKIFLILLIFIVSYSTFSQKILDSWKLGTYLGASFNLNALGFQDLSSLKQDFVPTVYVDGDGLRPYLNIFYEYKSGNWWGLELRASYDDRSGKVNDNSWSRNANFTLNTTYLNFEPLLKFYAGKEQEISFYSGLQFLFNLEKKYSYSLIENEKDITISKFNPFVLGYLAGASYDFALNNKNLGNVFYLSPFFEFSWIFNQREKTYQNTNQNFIDDIWSTFSFRTGLKLSIEFYPSVDVKENKEKIENFNIYSPESGNVRVRKYIEHFPFVFNIFFDKNSDEIPSRYSQLSKDIASIFDENTFLDKIKKGELNIKQYPIDQMTIYYNILNIFGDRLRKNPNTTVKLIGSDPFNNNGKLLAEKVKNYLINNFNIQESRIQIEAKKIPDIPSGSSTMDPQEKPKADLENRRVELAFSDIKLYEPYKFTYESESSPENDLIFNIENIDSVKSWTVSFINNQKTQSFGPFYESQIRIDPAKLMKGINESNYNVQVIITKKDNNNIIQDKDIYLKKIVLPENYSAYRFTLLFDYGKNDSVRTYQKTIIDYLIPIINEKNSIILHGHTDDIGKENTNLKLSLSRAKEVKDIFISNLQNSKAQIETIGFGEYYMHSYFDNTTPEGRFYNRNVVIDILPIIGK